MTLNMKKGGETIFLYCWALDGKCYKGNEEFSFCN